MQKRKLIAIIVVGVFISIVLSSRAYADTTDPAVSSKTRVSAIEKKISNAVPYPTDIQLMEQGERSYIYKTYTVAADYDPNNLIETSFSQGGYHFQYSEIIHREHSPESRAKPVSETKTIESETDDKSKILELMGDKLQYSDNDGYKGEMHINPDTLQITENGRTSYTYTISDIREYTGLDRNDPSYIPQTVMKSGVTLYLQSIGWNVTTSENMGYSDIPTSYSATAVYSAPATGSKTAGYTATVTFSGEAKKELVGKNIYTIVYEGEQVVIPVNYLPFIITGIIIIVFFAVCIVLLRLRKNVEVYVYQQGVPVLYCKERIKRQTPILKLTQLDGVQIRLVLSKKLAAMLNNQMLFVVGRYHNLRFLSDGNTIQDFWLANKNDSKPSPQNEEEEEI